MSRKSASKDEIMHQIIDLLNSHHSIKEISEITGISTNAIYKRINRLSKQIAKAKADSQQ